MGASGWNTIKKFGQWGGAFIFYGKTVVWVREFLTRPDRDILVDMIGSVVSLHSLYIGAAVGSGILALGCSWQSVLWAKGVYKRWKDERQKNSPSGKLRRLHNAVVREFNLTEQDKEFKASLSRSPMSKYAQREMLRFELSKCGIETPDPATDDDHIWYEFVTNLVPLSLHGRLEDAKIIGTGYARRDREDDG